MNDEESGLKRDLMEWLERLAPRGDYRHHATGEDNADAHLKRTLVHHQVILPVTKGELDLDLLMSKRAAIISTRLRPRPVEEKAAICAAVVEHVWPLIADGTIQPVVDTVLPFAEAGRAHALMESGESSGKIVLAVT